VGSTIHGTATPHSRDILAYPGPDTPKAVTNINTPHRRRSREPTPADLPTPHIKIGHEVRLPY
jgi:hypothetical protein